MERKELIYYFNANAEKRDVWIRRNRYYNKLLNKHIHFLVQPDSKILEIGCGTGQLLNFLEPKIGVGIDFSKEMIKIASSKYNRLKFEVADAHDFTISDKFDYIILSNVVGYFEDVQKVFRNIKKNCTKKTRIIIAYYNFLWEPILKLAEKLGLKMKEPFSNWLSRKDIENLLYLEGYDVVKSYELILFPKFVPIVSAVLNKYLARLPLIRKLCVESYIVARPCDPEEKREYSCSVIIPARNEAGNIEEAIKRMPKLGTHTEIIFVEGHSEDNTLDEIKRVAQDYAKEWDIKYFVQPGEGKADAVRKGFEEAKSDIFMILDADLTVPPKDLLKFYDAIASNKGEFINGSRLVYPTKKESMRTLNLLGNKFFGIAFTWILDQRFKDTLCGTKVLLKEDYEKIKENRKYFGEFDPFGDFDLIFGASKLNLKIVEVPIRYQERKYGRTNISRFKHGWLLLKMCFFAMRKIKFV
ncbi:MAG: glycosyltransferase [Candidatus Aminicenantes bacterium]|nr:MAG: glycosyltransferase [Candidatus Aminicenantes bacterium]